MPTNRLDDNVDFVPKKKGRPPKPRDEYGRIIPDPPSTKSTKSSISKAASVTSKSSDAGNPKYSGPKTYKKKESTLWGDSDEENSEEQSDDSLWHNRPKKSPRKTVSITSIKKVPSVTGDFIRRSSFRKAHAIDVNERLPLFFYNTNPKSLLDLDDEELPEFRYVMEAPRNEEDYYYVDNGGDGHVGGSSSSSSNLAALASANASLGPSNSSSSSSSAFNVVTPAVRERVTTQEVLRKLRDPGLKNNRHVSTPHKAGPNDSSTVGGIEPVSDADEQEERLFNLIAVRTSSGYYTEPPPEASSSSRLLAGLSSSGTRSAKEMLGLDAARNGVQPANISYCDYDADSDDEAFLNEKLQAGSVSLSVEVGQTRAERCSVSLRCFETMICVLERELELAKSLLPVKSVAVEYLTSYETQVLRVVSHSIKHVNRYLLEEDAALKDPDFEVASAHRGRSLGHLRKIVEQYEAELNQDGLDLSQIHKHKQGRGLNGSSGSSRAVGQSSVERGGSRSGSRNDANGLISIAAAGYQSDEVGSRSSSVEAQGSPSRGSSPSVSTQGSVRGSRSVSVSGADGINEGTSGSVDGAVANSEAASREKSKPSEKDGRVTTPANVNFSDEVLEASEALLDGSGTSHALDALMAIAMIHSSDDEQHPTVEKTGTGENADGNANGNTDAADVAAVTVSTESNRASLSKVPKHLKKKARVPRKKKDLQSDHLDPMTHPFFTPDQLRGMVSEDRACQLLMDVFEHHETNTSSASSNSSTVDAPVKLVREYCKRVYEYWLVKRSKRQVSFLRCYHWYINQWKHQSNLAVPLPGAYEGPSLREAYEQISTVKHDLDMAKVVLDRVRLREKLKRALVRTSREHLERQIKNGEEPLDPYSFCGSEMDRAAESPVTEYSSSDTDEVRVLLPPSLHLDDPEPLPTDSLFPSHIARQKMQFAASREPQEAEVIVIDADEAPKEVQGTTNDEIVLVVPEKKKNKGGRPPKNRVITEPESANSSHALATTSAAAAAEEVSDNGKKTKKPEEEKKDEPPAAPQKLGRGKWIRPSKKAAPPPNATADDEVEEVVPSKPAAPAVVASSALPKTTKAAAVAPVPAETADGRKKARGPTMDSADFQPAAKKAYKRKGVVVESSESEVEEVEMRTTRSRGVIQATTSSSAAAIVETGVAPAPVVSVSSSAGKVPAASTAAVAVVAPSQPDPVKPGPRGRGRAAKTAETSPTPEKDVAETTATASNSKEKKAKKQVQSSEDELVSEFSEDSRAKRNKRGKKTDEGVKSQKSTDKTAETVGSSEPANNTDMVRVRGFNVRRFNGSPPSTNKASISAAPAAGAEVESEELKAVESFVIPPVSVSTPPSSLSPENSPVVVAKKTRTNKAAAAPSTPEATASAARATPAPSTPAPATPPVRENPRVEKEAVRVPPPPALVAAPVEQPTPTASPLPLFSSSSSSSSSAINNGPLSNLTYRSAAGVTTVSSAWESLFASIAKTSVVGPSVAPKVSSGSAQGTTTSIPAVLEASKKRKLPDETAGGASSSSSAPAPALVTASVPAAAVIPQTTSDGFPVPVGGLRQDRVTQARDMLSRNSIPTLPVFNPPMSSAAMPGYPLYNPLMYAPFPAHPYFDPSGALVPPDLGLLDPRRLSGDTIHSHTHFTEGLPSSSSSAPSSGDKQKARKEGREQEKKKSDSRRSSRERRKYSDDDSGSDRSRNDYERRSSSRKRHSGGSDRRRSSHKGSSSSSSKYRRHEYSEDESEYSDDYYEDRRRHHGSSSSSNKPRTSGGRDDMPPVSLSQSSSSSSANRPASMVGNISGLAAAAAAAWQRSVDVTRQYEMSQSSSSASKRQRDRDDSRDRDRDRDRKRDRDSRERDRDSSNKRSKHEGESKKDASSSSSGKIWYIEDFQSDETDDDDEGRDEVNKDNVDDNEPSGTNKK